MKLLKTKAFPTLTSKRLLLRKPSLKDSSTYHRILSCPEVSRFSDIPHQPTTKRSERFVSWMSKLDTRGIGVAWLICVQSDSQDKGNNHKIGIAEKTANSPASSVSQKTGENLLINASNVIGSIRINSIEKKARCGMLGYELHPDFWGYGYATEALGAVVQLAHGELALNRLEAWTTEGNEASDRVLLRNGFQFEGMQREKAQLRDKLHNIRLFGRIVSDSKTG